MKVKVIRPFVNKDGMVSVEGSVIEVTPSRATELEKKGLVVPTIGGKTGASDPFPARQLGGQTGVEKLAPSLPADPAPVVEKKIRKLGKRKGSAKSSRSTTLFP